MIPKCGEPNLSPRSPSLNSLLRNQSNSNRIISSMVMIEHMKILYNGLPKLKILLPMRFMRKNKVQHLMVITMHLTDILHVLAKKHSF
jgi:hypothetical protein